jgi:nucleotide-binding universal stress UspA family protein
MFQKILWATDFSAHARDAGRKVLECAQCSHRPVDVLAVVAPDDLPPFLLDVPDPFIAEEAVHEAERRLAVEHEARVKHELESETQFLRDGGVEVTLHVRVGSPGDEILAAAQELGSDLIAMGSHGKRGLEDLLMGSTVEHVTKRAVCPVLIVR